MLGIHNSFFPSGYENNSNKLENNEVKIIKAPDFFSRTLNPMDTTASVIGIKYQDGVAIAADMGTNYGKLSHYRDIERLYKVNNSIVIASTGDFADFQYIRDVIKQKIISEEILDDSFSMKAFSLHTWLTRIMYNRRSKLDPLWNNVVVAGFDKDGPFLGMVDKLGLSYQDSYVSTGMGGYVAIPLLRDALEKTKGNMTKQQAQQLITQAMEVLYYRDTSSLPKFQIAFVTTEGVEISAPIEVTGSWEIANYVKGY